MNKKQIEKLLKKINRADELIMSAHDFHEELRQDLEEALQETED